MGDIGCEARLMEKCLLVIFRNDGDNFTRDKVNFNATLVHLSVDALLVIRDEVIAILVRIVATCASCPRYSKCGSRHSSWGYLGSALLPRSSSFGSGYAR